MLGTWTRGSRMEGADESTELWRHPNIFLIFHRNCSPMTFFKKMGQPQPLFRFIFGLFKQTLQFLQQIYVKKCPSSKWCWESNPWPLDRESLPITTRPGLPPFTYDFNLNISPEPGHEGICIAAPIDTFASKLHQSQMTHFFKKVGQTRLLLFIFVLFTWQI